MDIDLLSKMVKEIILEADAVTLPGLGSFVTEIVPASFSDRGYTINPPYRRLYFSPKQGDDTLLVDLYASSNPVSHEDATRIVVEFLARMKEELKVRKTIVFPELGRLRATRENNFFFVSDEDLDIYPYGFGLEPISLKNRPETREEVRDAVASLAEIVEGPAEPGAATTSVEIEAVAEAVPVVDTEFQESAAEPVEEAVAEPELMVEPEQEPITEQEPEPMAEPEQEVTEPASIAEPVAVQEPVTEQEPEPMVEPEQEVTEPVAEPVAEQEPIAEPVPITEPASIAEHVAVQEPVAEQEPEQEPAPASSTPSAPPVSSAPSTPPAPSTPSAPKRLSAWVVLGRMFLIAAGIVLVALVALAIVGRVAPDIVDNYLYTAEELEILRY